MASSRHFNGLINENSIRFMAEILKEDIVKRAVYFLNYLNENKSNVPLNPGREIPFTWHNPDLSDNIRDILSISIVLDECYSSEYAMVERQLNQAIHALANDKYSIVDLELHLADILLVEHVKRESDFVQYHREAHPNESAALAVRIQIHDKNGNTSSPIEQARAASAFAIHDAEYGDLADGINEIKSAALLFYAKLEAYKMLATQIQNDADLSLEKQNAAIIAIIAYQHFIAYEAWKSIVTGTMMLKKIDGQPTVFTAQKLGVEPILGIEPKIGNVLDRQTMVMSMVDSNFGAFIKTLQKDSLMGQYLPSHQLSGVPETIQALMFNAKESSLDAFQADKTLVDMGGLLYGQNERMFPEIHAVYKASLFKCLFNIVEAGKSIPMNGITLWNKAIEASRANDEGKVSNYLSAGIISPVEVLPFPPATVAPSPIAAGSTLQDIFFHRIDGEIRFAKGQGPELYQKLADKLGFKTPEMEYHLWREHSVQLENLNQRYQACDAKQRLEIAKALFYIAAHQPGVYIACEKRKRYLQAAIMNLETLEKKQAELEKQEISLAEEIAQLESLIDTSQADLKGTSERKDNELQSAFSMRQISYELSKAAGGAAQINLNEKKTELEEKIKSRTHILTEINNIKKLIILRPQQILNLLRAKMELEKITQVKTDLEEKKILPTKHQ